MFFNGDFPWGFSMGMQNQLYIYNMTIYLVGGLEYND